MQSPVDNIRSYIILLSPDSVPVKILMDLEIIQAKLNSLELAGNKISASADMLGVLESGDDLIKDTLPRLLDMAWRHKGNSK